MRYTAFYIFRGKPELKTLLQRGEYGNLGNLLGPEMWANEQGGRSSFMPSDYQASMKKLFVAYVKYLVLQPGEEEEIFGNLSIDEGAFDRWWNIEVFDGYDMSTVEILKDLKSLNLPDVDKLFFPLSDSIVD